MPQEVLLPQDDYIQQGKLGRHETFTPRYGWLKKGYEGVKSDKNIFKADNAIEKLGVGKNMVSSIKYWCQAFKIIEIHNNGNIELTAFGKKLLDDAGWDPYLEDIASLWLLHWQLYLPRLESISWSFAFNKCNLWSFDIQQLSSVIITAAQNYPKFSSVSSKSFEKDASCIIRMYTETFSKENEIECPFTQLGLMRLSDDDKAFYFNTYEKQTLPDLIFSAACFSFVDNYGSKNQKTVSIERLSYDFNSPGNVFKLSESEVGKKLYSATKALPGFELIESLGSVQIHFHESPEELYWKALETYYTEE